MNLDRILSSPQDHFSKGPSRLRTVITSLSSGSVGEIIGKDPANRFNRAPRGGGECDTGGADGLPSNKEDCPHNGDVLLSMVQSFVGRVLASQNKIDPPLAVRVDEVSNVLYFGTDDLFNKAGGAGVALHADAEQAGSRGRTRHRLRRQTIFRINDPNTAA